MTTKQIKLVKENERLRTSLAKLIQILADQLEAKDTWIETLHAVQEAQALLGLPIIGEEQTEKP